MAVETHFYNLLEITPTATEDEILKSYRNLARIYHPDRNPDGVERFQEIVEAYKVLSDPEQGSHKNILCPLENLHPHSTIPVRFKLYLVVTFWSCTYLHYDISPKFDTHLHLH